MKRQLKEGDWIALRLLALLLKTDVSNQSIPDVRKTMDYYRHELGVPLFSVLWELIKETADEVENPESAMLRRFEKTLGEADIWESVSDITLDGRVKENT